MEKLRTPLFIAALAIMLAVVLVEAGSNGIVKAFVDNTTVSGLGVKYLALLDALVLFTVTLMGASLVFPQDTLSKVQGIGTLVVSIIVVISSIVMIFTAIALLMLMITLFLAIPFGTIIYLAKYSDFPRGSVAATLSSMMFLKMAFAACLVFAHQRFLQNKGLVLIIASSLVASIIVSFLHGLVPTPLVSITDAIAAIVIAIITIIWGIFFLIGSIPAILKAATSVVPKP